MAQGNYGTSDNPLEEIHGEQVVYEPLTSDPNDREEGSVWFRADMDSGDKVGTFRIQNDDAGNDIDDWPAFDEGDSVNGVVKVLPVQTQNGEAFRPYIEEGGAFDQHRLQHNGTWYGAHDSLVAIPDSVRNQNDWPHDEGSGTTLGDSQGSLDGTINGATWQTGVGRGGAYLQYDGTNNGTDLGSASRTALTNLTNALTGSFGCWINPDNVSSFQTIFGNTFQTQDVGLLFRIQNDAGIVLRVLNGSGDESGRVDAPGGTVSASDWEPIAFTMDGSAARLYYGESLSEVGSASVSGGTSSDWSQNAHFGVRSSDNDQRFAGGVDDAWHSDVQVSQSDLQSWVDATKGNYS